MGKTKLILLLFTIIVPCVISGFNFINKSFNSESKLLVNNFDSFSLINNSTNTIIRYADDFNGTNDTNALKARGYLIYYRSSGPQGTSAIWFQGKPSYFPSYNGPANGYVAADFNSVTVQNNIDNWLVLPRITGGILLNDMLYFFSKAEQNNPYADSIRVMYSTVDSVPEGSWQEIGRFKVNTSGFWEQRGFKSTAPDINGRFAIRYCVANRGPNGQNSNYIGIDAVSIVTDTSKPVITHTEFTYIPKLNWPAKIICQVSGQNGIDSVWVRWKRNSGNYQSFNLTNDSLTLWTGLFNSDTSQVKVNDSIFYRIVARSASLQHPIDSTELYKFIIFFTIGSGDISSEYPFSGNSDGRTDMLYLSSEISSSEISHGSIRAIGFNIRYIIPFSYKNLRIKMQTVSDSSINSFSYSGWTNCLDGAFASTNKGWQFISLTTPFYWNVGQNLLVEICYNMPQSVTLFLVYSSIIYNKVYGFHANLPNFDGCTVFTAGQNVQYRPNLGFIIDPMNISNSIKNKNGVPDKFNLSQNYPNLFNPNTKIDYSIPKNGFVILKIYDVLGREIKTLVNENKTAGYYSIDFNGSEFPSGVYFYKLESNEFGDVKRMILIK
jgi:hypothetical protein